MGFEVLNYSTIDEQLDISSIGKWSILYLGSHFGGGWKDINLGYFASCLEMKIKL